MITKRECLLNYFRCYPEYLKMLQDKEDGLTQKTLAEKYKCKEDNIKRIRKEMIQMFGINIGGWKELCYEAGLYDFITTKAKTGYVFNEHACSHLLAWQEEYEMKEEDKQKRERDKKWDKRKKELGWRKDMA